MAKEKQRRAFDAINEFPTTVGAQSVVHGDMLGRNNCLVLGKVIGNGRLEGSVIVGNGGLWRGTLEAENVMVAGEVEGDITARNQIEVLASARIEGRLTCATIAIASGAFHQGEVRMAKEGAGLTYFAEKREARR